MSQSQRQRERAAERFTTPLSHTILVIEDDAALVRSIERNLSAWGYATETAGDVSAACLQIEGLRPDLALLDIDLPDGSGWEVFRTLRAHHGPDVPVIVIAGLRPNQRLVQELSCLAVLEKPFPMEALLRLIRDALGDSDPLESSLPPAPAERTL